MDRLIVMVKGSNLKEVRPASQDLHAQGWSQSP